MMSDSHDLQKSLLKVPIRANRNFFQWETENSLKCKKFQNSALVEGQIETLTEWLYYFNSIADNICIDVDMNQVKTTLKMALKLQNQYFHLKIN